MRIRLIEPAALVGDVGKPGVHVPRAAQRRLGPRRASEAGLIDVRRVAEPSRGEPDVRADDRAADHVADQARPLETRHPLRVPVISPFEIPHPPVGQSKERLGAASPDVIAVLDELEHPSGVRDVALEIAMHLRHGGAVQLDHGGETPIFGFVDDDRVTGRDRTLGRSQELLGSLDLVC
jgi:hypothetical protein